MAARNWLPIVVILFIWSLTTHGKFSNSGDEPHYLMIAESLISDGDLDLENNFREGDQRWFGADDLAPGPHAYRTRSGALWSVHDVGVPIVVAPVYAVASRLAARVPEAWLAGVRQTRGLFAYSLVSVSLIVLTALSIRLLYLAFGRRVSSARAATVALALALSPPVLSHAFLIFPETIAFAVVCAVVWVLCAGEREVTPTRLFLVVLAVGLMPWLHRKYSPLVFGLVFVIARQHWGSIRQQPRLHQGALLAAALLPQVALYAWTWNAWGNVGGPHMLQDVPFSLAWLPEGALGMLLDRERGLLGYAPLYVLAPAVFVLSWRSRPDTGWLLVPIAIFYLVMASYVTWDAGFSPAARFLVPLTPLVALAAIHALESRALRAIAIPLLMFQAAITAVVWNRPRSLWPKEQAANQALDAIPVAGPAWSSVLPSLHTGDSVTYGLMTLAGVAAITIAILVAHRTSMRSR